MSDSGVLDSRPVSTAMKQRNEPRATAESMATKQRDISVSEFFAKNRHLLGFDNPRKALLTAVKEAVDNSLDACEEAGILPDITVIIEDVDDGTKGRSDGATKGEEKTGKKSKASQSSRYRVTVVDNGPGIVRKQVENVFGRLLFGSKFHRLKMSRGQQGIGISAAGMYGLITTGKPMLIQTRPKASQQAHHIELAMNTKTNRAEVTVDEETDDFPLARLRELTIGTRELTASDQYLSPRDYPTGTSVSIDLEGRYQKGRGSVDEFLELTAIANPHAKITFVPPSKFAVDESEAGELAFAARKKRSKDQIQVEGGDEPDSSKDASDAVEGQEPVAAAPAAPVTTTETSGVILFPRAVHELPPETKEIQPHPKGIELGILLQMLKDYEASEKGGTLYKFLQDRFSRISHQLAASFCEKIGATSRTKVADIEPQQAEKLFQEFQEAKLAPPPTDCLAPIGVRQLLAGMLKGVRAEFYAASSREAEVYRGRPFQIEAAIAFGGELPRDETARVIRFANRVPLLFQQSACSSFKSVAETNWRNYDLQQPRGGVPVGPLVIMIHMASVWVPFTSESKEAIADYDEIRKEMKLALMECGRKLGTYLKKRAKMKREGQRRDVFQKYIGEIAKACNAITGVDAKKLYDALLEQAKKKTAIADLELDEDGRAVRDDAGDQEGVIIIETPSEDGGGEGANDGLPIATGNVEKKGAAKSDDPFTVSKTEAAMLKVASLRDDDEQPRLIDTKLPKRLSQKGKVEAKPAGKSEKTEKTAAITASVQKSSSGAKPATAPTPPAPHQPKLKMRLVNGKLVRVDEGPKLF
ncbi:MAG: DNA topoisomerase VI subunit B [Pyrinomonadaceae bacterium]|nr:DNA topoisomerase VI subunit B [Phycisphaerales bacterium]